MKFTLATLAGLATTAVAFTPSSFVRTTSVSHRVSDVSSTSLAMKYKVAVVGGGPSGACAAEIFAQEKNIDTVLFERKLDNAKPCGGAIPLCMVGEFDLPESVVDRKVRRKKFKMTTRCNIRLYLLEFITLFHCLPPSGTQGLVVRWFHQPHALILFMYLMYLLFIFSGSQDEPYLAHRC